MGLLYNYLLVWLLIGLRSYLAVTDGLIIDAQSATNLVVLRAGIHPLLEVEHVLGRLRRHNVSVTGFVLNDLLPRSAAYGYRKYGYAYSYNYPGKSERATKRTPLPH